MNKEKIIWVKIKTDRYYNIFIKLNNVGINIFDNKKGKDYLLIKTTYEDYQRIKKYLVSYECEIVGVTGLPKVTKIIHKYAFFTMGTILGIVLLILANNMIFKVDIKTPNGEIKTLLKNELAKYNLKTLRMKKNHRQVEKIVTQILDNNKDTLEWLEIKYDGLVMVVNVTEKTKTTQEKVYDNCNVIAASDAKIISLNIYQGVALKEINDYVTKGEVILTGNIMHNEEIKNTVCANGEVYGEVWYKVKVTVPFQEDYVFYTGKKRYNLNVKINDNKYAILRSRIDKKKIEEINLYKLNDFEINLVKEKEYVMKTRILSVDEAYQKGLKLAIDKINIKLDDNEAILVKKVLKKEVNDSTIYLEVFIATKENIGVLSVIEGVDENGSEFNKTSN